MIAYLFNENGEFKYHYECQLDPLESKAQGKDIYLQPANSTFVEPPVVAENHKAIWNGEQWIDVDFTPKVEEPKQPTEKELLQIQIDELKGKLYNTDYKAIKFAEGELSAEEYAETKEQRRQWRQEINKLELLLK